MSIEKPKNILGKYPVVEIANRKAVLKKLTGKSLNVLAVEAGVSNGTADDWTDKQIEKPSRTVSDFLSHHKISEKWWKSGEGEVFITPAINSDSSDNNTDPKEMKEGVYQTIVEGHTEYVLIPRSVLNETQLVSKDQINRTWVELDKRSTELADRNKQFDLLLNQLNQIYEKFELIPKTLKTKEV